MASENVLMEFAALSQSIGADLLAFSSRAASGFSSVSIDSRTAEEGSLFVALSGSASDGHRHIGDAFKAGADAAMVETAKLASSGAAAIAKDLGKTLIVVDNTLRGLQNSARVYLEQFPGLLKIGITGSSGKTTAKEITAAIIGVEKNTVMNPGNYNSETGLPLAVFAVRPWHEAGVFEMGMNRNGEIGELAAVLKPNIALITNIGSAHIGIFGSKQAIAKEKKNIFSQFTGNEIALIPEDDEYRDFLAEGLQGQVRFYGPKSFKELGEIKDMGLEGSRIIWEGEGIHFGLPGRHSLADALAALAIAREIPVSRNAVKRGLESARPLFGRGEIIRGRTTVIRDCYNANPESLDCALDFCDSLDWQGRRIYVIGDMLELGDNSPAAHERIGRRLYASRADMVFLYGKEIAAAKAFMKDRPFSHFSDMGELGRALDGFVQSGDLVLLKGSRRCALEQLSAMLAGSNEGAA